jgi:hypothetical protein
MKAVVSAWSVKTIMVDGRVSNQFSFGKKQVFKVLLKLF